MAKILIAEDSATAVELIKRTLSPLGHQIVIASDGENAERLILDEKPDLIILDITMPVMNGVEMLPQRRFDHPRPVAHRVPAHHAGW